MKTVELNAQEAAALKLAGYLQPMVSELCGHDPDAVIAIMIAVVIETAIQIGVHVSVEAARIRLADVAAAIDHCHREMGNSVARIKGKGAQG